MNPITKIKDLLEMSKSIESADFIIKYKEKEEERRRKELNAVPEQQPNLSNSPS